MPKKLFGKYKARDKWPPDGSIPGCTKAGGLPCAIDYKTSRDFDLDVLAIYGTEKTGICMIRAIRLIENDHTGKQIASGVEKAEKRISINYGTPIRRINNLVSDARHYNSLGLMARLTQGELEYKIEWKVDEGGISGIELSAHGRNASNGYYIIEYQFTNYDECMAEVSSGL